MKSIRRYIVLVFLAIGLPIFVNAQGTSVTDRTPEQEAAKQTEKMQKELNLTPEQAKDVYDINLKYARERKQSNKRSDAVSRIKKKNEEISKILNARQNNELKTKRADTQSVEIDGKRNFTRTTGPTRASGNVRRTLPDVQMQDRPVRTRNDVQTTRSNSTRESDPSPANRSGGVRKDNRSQEPVRGTSSGNYERNQPVRSSEARSRTYESASSRSQSTERSGAENKQPERSSQRQTGSRR